MIVEEDHIPPSSDECLEDFIITFKASLDPRLWIKLIREESAELLAEEPGTVEHLKEAADLMYVLEGFYSVAPDRMTLLLGDEEFSDMDNLIEDSTELLEAAETYYSHDVVYDAFLFVHESNMSKLGDDGQPMFREDGKVLKGPNYKAPDLTHLI
jgi:hypothetical protein